MPLEDDLRPELRLPDFAVVFRVDDLRALDFRPVDLRPVDLRDEVVELRLRGTFSPFSRASLIPIAIACLRLVTLRPPRVLSVPSARLRAALATVALAFLLYLWPDDFRPDDFRPALLDFLAAI